MRITTPSPNAQCAHLEVITTRIDTGSSRNIPGQRQICSSSVTLYTPTPIFIFTCFHKTYRISGASRRSTRSPEPSQGKTDSYHYHILVPDPDYKVKETSGRSRLRNHVYIGALLHAGKSITTSLSPGCPRFHG